MRSKYNLATSIAAILITTSAHAQLKLQECYESARQNYPMVKQHELIQKSRDYSVHNASLGYLPTVAINGQQSYQSDVTKVPGIPGQDFMITPLSKNQYRIYADVNLNLYDGGAIRQQKQIHEANANMEEQSLEVELYKLNERVNQVFFGILLLDGQLTQQGLLLGDLESGLKKTNAAIANGTALKSSGEVLQAEILKTKQSSIELSASRSGYLDMLSILTGKPLDEQTVLQLPIVALKASKINRPELKLYDSQFSRISVEQKVLNTRIKPRVSSFLQAGYGRPGLNMLNPNADTYYIAGFRLNWNLSGLYTYKKDKILLDVKRATINLQKETFVFNNNYEVKKQSSEVNKLMQLASTDDEIIALRTKVKQTSSVQLENGVIDSNDYLHEVNAENLARQSKVIHEIQLLLAQYTLQTINGI
ncbi:MAG: TolC family protein [Chryseolinea sp.]